MFGVGEIEGVVVVADERVFAELDGLLIKNVHLFLCELESLEQLALHLVREILLQQVRVAG